jgi:hypothetical protein
LLALEIERKKSILGRAQWTLLRNIEQMKFKNNRFSVWENAGDTGRRKVVKMYSCTKSIRWEWYCLLCPNSAL